LCPDRQKRLSKEKHLSNCHSTTAAVYIDNSREIITKRFLFYSLQIVLKKPMEYCKLIDKRRTCWEFVLK
jgi:hypothetical protein